MASKILMTILSLACLALAAVLVRGAATQPGGEQPQTLPLPASQPTAVRLPSKLNMVLADVRLDSATLDQALDRLAQLSHANFAVHWSKIKSAGAGSQRVTLELWNISMERALKVILLAYSGPKGEVEFFEDEQGVITISTDDERPIQTVTRIYDVRDIMERISSNPQWAKEIELLRETGTAPTSPIEPITQLIQGYIAQDSWAGNGGTIGTASQMFGLLIVKNTPEVQIAVAKFLDELRAALNRPTTRPAIQP